jgi:subtilisin family serine protease
MATSPNSTYTEIVTTTLAGYSKTMADNVTNNNALLRHIDRNGNKMPATGRTIVQELEYAVNSTTKWYSGYEVLDTSTSNVFTAAEFNYKQLAGNVVISGLEQVENSGPEQIFNLLKSRIRNLEKSLKNDMATALYADGTGTDSKELGGLQLLVPGTVGNTVGGINSGTYTFWANQVYDFSTERRYPFRHHDPDGHEYSLAGLYSRCGSAKRDRRRFGLFRVLLGVLADEPAVYL